jgi:hypothetical protein
MQIVECYGKNVFVGKTMVGYIARKGIFINRQKFADLTPDGDIIRANVKVGFVDEDGYIMIKDKEVGYVDTDNNFVFYSIKEL